MSDPIRTTPPESDVAAVQADLGLILDALGLGTHARPYSPRDVVHREVLPAIHALAERKTRASGEFSYPAVLADVTRILEEYASAVERQVREHIAADIEAAANERDQQIADIVGSSTIRRSMTTDGMRRSARIALGGTS